MSDQDVQLLSTEESVDLVARLLGGAVRPEMFLLDGGELVARLTVDPDIAMAALARWEER